MKKLQPKTLRLHKESLRHLTAGQPNAVAFTAFVNCSIRFCPTGEVVCPHQTT